MNPEFAPQERDSKGGFFSPTPESILYNREVVTDFFGDNRETYALLKKPTATRPSLALETKELIPHDEDREKNEEEQRVMPTDDLPLDPSQITQERAKHIADFFREYPTALSDYLEYYKWYTKNHATNEPAS